MEGVRRVNSRRATPKVRTGCITCKSRRVKCDEVKPSCDRCTKAGLNCKGYASEISKPAREFRFIPSYSIPFKVPGSQADRQLLHYYSCEAAWDLSSYADPALWTNLLLQRGHDEPVIRHALVALSSLHKDFVLGKLSNSVQDKFVPSIETLTMISGCHRKLTNYLSQSTASNDVALACSLVFYAFEALIGDQKRAIWHLDQGLSLLKQTETQVDGSNLDALYSHMAALYKRLDVQASVYDPWRIPLLRIAAGNATLEARALVPHVLANLAHAEDVLLYLQNWVLHHLISNVEHKGKPLVEIPQATLREKTLLLQYLRSYGSALDHLCDTLRQESSGASTTRSQAEKKGQRAQRLLLLQMDFLSFQYLVKESVPSWVDGQSGLDNDLDRVLLHIEALLAMPDVQTSDSGRDTPLAGPRKRTYTLSTNMVALLYYVSMKTSRHKTLVKAGELFSHPSMANARDGVWDAQTAAFVVRQMIDKRDQDTRTSATKTWNPDSNPKPAPKGCHNHGQQQNFSTRLNPDTLEAFGTGLVDAQGGVEEAATLLSNWMDSMNIGT